MSRPRDGASGGWTAERERSNLLALRLMRWVAIGAGRRMTRLLLHPISVYYLLVNGRARRASLDYLVRVLDRPARLADVYRHIHCFASTVLDRVYFLQERHEQFEVTASGVETVLPVLAQGEGVILIGAHLGSFEALRASAHAPGVKVAMLMFEENARLINAALAVVAPHAQLCTIALGKPGAMLALRRWLDDGGLAGLLADRTLPGGSQRSNILAIDFLGKPARFSDGPFRLAALLRRKVVFMAGLYQGGNRYTMRFVELADFRPGAATAGLDIDIDTRVRESLNRYVALLETLCRESPYNWFNFYDFWAADATEFPDPR